MKFVHVAISELDDLKASSSTLELAFFGICIGAFITIVTTLATVTIPESSTHAAFLGLAYVSGVATVYFGLATFRSELRWRRKVDNIKRGRDPE